MSISSKKIVGFLILIIFGAPSFVFAGQDHPETNGPEINGVDDSTENMSTLKPAENDHNHLSQAEIDEGWQLLFDGQTTKGWHTFGEDKVRPQWKIVDGQLMLSEKGGSDILTDQKFGSFELTLEWKISKGGNSGIFYHGLEENQDVIYWSAVEYQILDDENHSNGKDPLHRAGAVYDLYAPAFSVTNPAGTYNRTRILIDKGHVEHWLNDRKVAEYDYGSDDWNRRLAASKFADKPLFARASSGHIALQDHGDKVWYRNIKIRPLD